jgi:acyl-CoA synthetase (AMP-forming)/AMP-acid ligase II
MTDVNHSVYSLLQHWANETPDATALGTPAGRSLSYAMLLEEIDAVRATLNALGIGREDRVSIVLPNGLEMAVAFLAVSSAATCAPLNPASRRRLPRRRRDRRDPPSRSPPSARAGSCAHSATRSIRAGDQVACTAASTRLVA